MTIVLEVRNGRPYGYICDTCASDPGPLDHLFKRYRVKAQPFRRCWVCGGSNLSDEEMQAYKESVE